MKTREVRDGEEKGYILMCYLRALFCPSFLFLPRLVHRRIDKMASWWWLLFIILLNLEFATILSSVTTSSLLS